MRPVFNIAPRVVVYPHGTPPPAVEDGWLTLAQFDSWPPAALDSPLPPQSDSGLAAARSMAAPGLAPEPPQHTALKLARARLGPEPGGPVVTLQRHAVFGDGSHATTRLCAGAVDLLCRQRPGMAVLDVGTGTGILARIARARGASFVVGTDIDPTAVACAKAHAELDEFGSPVGTATDPVGVGGSTGPGVCATEIDGGTRRANIYFGGEAPDHWGARFDLVVANILEAPLHSLALALCRALLPGGVLLISGFTRPQAPALRLAYETTGLQSAGDFTFDEWVLLKFTAH